jgi:hypothetical protein
MECVRRVHPMLQFGWNGQPVRRIPPMGRLEGCWAGASTWSRALAPVAERRLQGNAAAPTWQVQASRWRVPERKALAQYGSALTFRQIDSRPLIGWRRQVLASGSCVCPPLSP